MPGANRWSRSAHIALGLLAEDTPCARLAYLQPRVDEPMSNTVLRVVKPRFNGASVGIQGRAGSGDVLKRRRRGGGGGIHKSREE
jgi:hypothetical protein